MTTSKLSDGALSNTSYTKILLACISGLLALSCFLLANAYHVISTDVALNKSQSTINKTRLDNVEKDIEEIKDSVGALNETFKNFVYNRYGYIQGDTSTY